MPLELSSVTSPLNIQILKLQDLGEDVVPTGLFQEVRTSLLVCSFPWRPAIFTLCVRSPLQPSCHCSVSTTQPTAPWTDLLPFPAFCTSTNWKFGWPCLFIFLEFSGLYFHGIFSAVQRFNFKRRQWEEKPVPVSRLYPQFEFAILPLQIVTKRKRSEMPVFSWN